MSDLTNTPPSRASIDRHAKLAQLGAKVLEILRDPSAAAEAAAEEHAWHEGHVDACPVCAGPSAGDGVHRMIEAAARDLLTKGAHP